HLLEQLAVTFDPRLTRFLGHATRSRCRDHARKHAPDAAERTQRTGTLQQLLVRLFGATWRTVTSPHQVLGPARIEERVALTGTGHHLQEPKAPAVHVIEQARLPRENLGPGSTVSEIQRRKPEFLREQVRKWLGTEAAERLRGADAREVAPGF